MKFVLSGGGTAGHINPALAVAQELMQRGHEVRFAGTPDSLEERLVGKAHIPFVAFDAAGFDRAHKSTLITSSMRLVKSTGAAKRWLQEEAPDAVIGFGAYVSIPVGRAATALNIPLLIHEQNSVPGMTNRYLCSKACAVAVTYEHSLEGLKTSSPCFLTGNPVRAGLFGHTREQARSALEVPQDALFLLVFGGSQGARHLNTALTQLAPTLLERSNLYIFHVTGPKEYATVEHALEQQGIDVGPQSRYRLFSYFDRMGEALSACDATVARAGATSIAEITSLGVPALLVPFPYATENHQMLNAQSVVQAGAALLVSDDQVENPVFYETLTRLLDDESLRSDMRSASLAMGTGSATARVADLAIAAAAHDVDSCGMQKVSSC